jgi:hypothetical protein
VAAACSGRKGTQRPWRKGQSPQPAPWSSCSRACRRSRASPCSRSRRGRACEPAELSHQPRSVAAISCGGRSCLAPGGEAWLRLEAQERNRGRRLQQAGERRIICARGSPTAFSRPAPSQPSGRSTGPTLVRSISSRSISGTGPLPCLGVPNTLRNPAPRFTNSRIAWQQGRSPAGPHLLKQLRHARPG